MDKTSQKKRKNIQEGVEEFNNLLHLNNDKEPQIKEITVGEVIKKYHENEYIIGVWYQRNAVWTEKEKRDYNLNIVKNFAPSQITLSKRKDGSCAVIDGGNRIVALTEFLTNKFPLKLKIDNKTCNLYFDDLNSKQQENFKNKKLFIVSYENLHNDEESILFQNINKGKPLNKDEKLKAANMKLTDTLEKIVKEVLEQHGIYHINKDFNKRQQLNTTCITALKYNKEKRWSGKIKSNPEEIEKLEISVEEISNLKRALYKFFQVYKEKATKHNIQRAIMLGLLMAYIDKLEKINDKQIKTLFNDFFYTVGKYKGEFNQEEYNRMNNFVCNIICSTKLSEYKRKVSDSLRLAVIKRDGNRCVYCGGKDNLHVDHEVRICDGGKTEESNLRTLCSSCNHGRESKDNKEKGL